MSINEDVARELYLYGTTSSAPSYKLAKRLVGVLVKKVRAGVYDPKRALRVWERWTDFVHAEHLREYGTKLQMNADTRRDVAKDAQEYYDEELKRAIRAIGGETYYTRGGKVGLIRKNPKRSKRGARKNPTRKVIAVSEYRYRMSAAERRAHPGTTVTQFIVRYADEDKWETIKAYGKTPGERKSAAIAEFRARREGVRKNPTVWPAFEMEPGMRVRRVTSEGTGSPGKVVAVQRVSTHFIVTVKIPAKRMPGGKKGVKGRLVAYRDGEFIVG